MSMGLGAWQMPNGVLAWGALVIGCLCTLVALGRTLGDRLLDRARPWGIGAVGAFAALTSAVYVEVVLRGGPRIIDATMYWLQSRLFAAGQLTLTTPGPASSVRGRFLLETEPGHFAGIFPPGYPAVLAVFQRFGAPWLLGPLLAMALCVVTARLAAALVDDPALRPRAALCAAILSALCGALRYHTADTMAHGLTALACSLALLCALCTRRAGFVAAGALLGVVLLTRFASALALGCVLLALAWRHPRRLHALAALALGALPFVVALGVYQRALTGRAWLAPQALYYLRADAPWGCFRYGFGAGIGCSFEHDVLVGRELPEHFYGPWQALGVSARRLRLHLLDCANFELLALLVPFAAWRLARRRPALLPLLLYPLAVMLAYAPFYFDGNFPGGGARLWSDALGVEHAVLAAVIVQNARIAWGVLAASAFGFAVHAAPEHDKLRDRDGGRPMWDDALWDGAPLVFTNTDHGFDQAFRPDADARRIVRLRGDANDWLSARTAPAAQLVFFDVEHGFRRERHVPAQTWWFEGEHEWPVRGADDATAIPGAGCGAGRALWMQPRAEHGAPQIRTSVYVLRAGTQHLRLRASGTAVTLGVDDRPPRRVELSGDPCFEADLGTFELAAGDHSLRWNLHDGPVRFDALEVRAVPDAP